MEHPENNEAYKGLTVNQGVEQPSIVNPYLNLRKKPKRRQYSAAEYVEGIVKGDVTMLSQAVTLVESVKPEHQVLAQEVIEKCLPYSGNSIRIGISGVPGAGKSTSIDVFGLHVLEEKGGKLAVLAIDPSSERSKGSILGDKTRMEKLSVHPKSFIRPSPSAGSLGGVARKTRETIILCEAAGFDKIFVETVGVGQSETAVHSMVDFFLLIQLAGTGDELQGIKRGIMEMADGIIINKADGNNVEKAQLAATHFRHPRRRRRSAPFENRYCKNYNGHSRSKRPAIRVPARRPRKAALRSARPVRCRRSSGRVAFRARRDRRVFAPERSRP